MSGIFSRDTSPAESEDEPPPDLPRPLLARSTGQGYAGVGAPVSSSVLRAAETDMWGELGPPPPTPTLGRENAVFGDIPSPPLVRRNARAMPPPEVDILENVPAIFFRDETWRRHFASPDADFVANEERKRTEPEAYEVVERIEKLISDRFITDLPTYVSGLRRSDPVKYDLNAGPRVINVRFVIHLLQNFRSIQTMPMVMEDRYRFIIMLRTFLMYIPIETLYEFLDILFSRTGGRKTKKKKKKKKQTRR
jgi:hypothetical protein